jgi:hypothetical protein
MVRKSGSEIDRLIGEILSETQNVKNSAVIAIKSLNEEISNLRFNLGNLRESLATAEQDGDQSAAEKCLFQISKLKIEIENLEERRLAHQAAATKGKNQTAKIERIRLLCPSDAVEQSENEKFIISQIKEKEELIKKINKEIADLGGKIQANISRSLESRLMPIVDIIEPRTKTLDDFERRKFLNIWLGGEAGNLEDLFNPLDQTKTSEVQGPPTNKTGE